MNKKKVCMIALRHAYLDSRVFYKQAKSLHEHGYDVVVLGKGNTNKIEEGIELVACSSIIQAIIFLFRKKFDVYHAHDQTSLVVAILLSLFKKTPFIYDIHEHYFLFSRMSRGVKKWIINILYAYIIEPIGLRLARVCIGVTPTMQHHYTSKVKKFFLVPNYYAGNMQESISSSIRPAPFTNNIVLLYQGGMKKERGIYEYVDIVKKVSLTIPHVLLHCIGPFTTAQEQDEFLSYVKKQEATDLVVYTPPVSFGELTMYTRYADIGLNFLADTLNNNVGIQNKIFEYFAHGLPVVSTENVLYMCNTIAPTGAGIVVSYSDTDQASSRITQMIQHMDTYKQSVYDIRANYIWKQGAEKILLDAYNYAV